DDLRFLMFGELEKLAKGRKVADLAATIKERKRQFKEAAKAVLPDTFVGVPEVRVRRVSRKRARQLTGLGVSGGVATGRARIIPDALAMSDREIDDGEILVAPFTDAPWTPLFI